MKWEYHVGYWGMFSSSDEGLRRTEDYLNQRGAEGWEVVTIAQTTAGRWIIVLKRAACAAAAAGTREE